MGVQLRQDTLNVLTFVFSLFCLNLLVFLFFLGIFDEASNQFRFICYSLVQPALPFSFRIHSPPYAFSCRVSSIKGLLTINLKSPGGLFVRFFAFYFYFFLFFFFFVLFCTVVCILRARV